MPEKRTCEWCGNKLLVKDTAEERNTWTSDPRYRCRACFEARVAKFVEDVRKRLGLSPLET